jgi:hypothetical protein
MPSSPMHFRLEILVRRMLRIKRRDFWICPFYGHSVWTKRPQYIFYYETWLCASFGFSRSSHSATTGEDHLCFNFTSTTRRRGRFSARFCFWPKALSQAFCSALAALYCVGPPLYAISLLSSEVGRPSCIGMALRELSSEVAWYFFALFTA